jgi:hypothetical protein
MGKYKKRENNTITKEYRAYKGMKSRCYSASNSKKTYQQKGIKVCQRWLDSFDNFVDDMGESPTNKHSLDRIDNNGDYCKDNCRWATDDTQSNNRGEFNLLYTFDGVTLTLKQWSRKLNIKYLTLYSRMFRDGFSFEYSIDENNFGNLIEYNGESKSMKEWCEQLNFPVSLAYDRKCRGWSIKDIFETPKGKSPNKI